ncbi:MAG: InlB B-repeat-containing protein [Clostridium sp.]
MREIIDKLEDVMYKGKDFLEDVLYYIYDVLYKIGIKKRKEQNIIIILTIILIITLISSVITINRKKHEAKMMQMQREEVQEEKTKITQYSFLNNRLIEMYNDGGYTSLKTYLALLEKTNKQELNNDKNIGKIYLENNRYVLEYSLEKEKQYILKQDSSNTFRILELEKEIESKGINVRIDLEEYIKNVQMLDFSNEKIESINRNNIQKGTLKFADILVDDKDEESQKVYNLLLENINNMKKNTNSDTNNVNNQNNQSNDLNNPENVEKNNDEKKKILVQFKSEDTLFSEMKIDVGTAPLDPGIPFKSGYKFVGWNVNISNALYEDTVIKAKWMKEDKLEGKAVCIFNLNGGHGEIQSQIVDKGTVLKYIGVPTKKGYKFAGWTPDINSKIEEDTIFRAKWEKE